MKKKQRQEGKQASEEGRWLGKNNMMNIKKKMLNED